MAQLYNCQPVEPFVAEEFYGDNFADSTLQNQAPPTGALISSTPINTWYFLKIKASPGYRIDAGMINIYGDNDVLINPNTEAQAADTGQGYPNGIYVYNLFGENASLPYVYTIRMFDSLAGDYGQCDNEVIVEVQLDPAFEMPQVDTTIAIDFGGQAIECDPSTVTNPDNTVVNPPSETNNVASSEIYSSELFISNYDPGDSLDYYIALYYQSETYASSNFNLENESYSGINPYASIPFASYLPTYDYNGNYALAFPEVYTDCINSYQPTCYIRYENAFEANEFYEAPTDLAPNVITTVCGQVSALNNSISQYQPNDPNHPNINNPMLVQQGGVTRNKFIAKCSANSNNERYLPIGEYPTITPGDEVLQSSVCYYVNVSENSGKDLIANSAFIDVWKIVTIDDRTETPAYSGTPPSNTCDLNTENFNYFVSDNGTNESDLDINNITLTQINAQTVKIEIPYKNGLSIDRYGPEGNIDYKRINKIFVNIYPTDSDQPL